MRKQIWKLGMICLRSCNDDVKTTTIQAFWPFVKLPGMLCLVARLCLTLQSHGLCDCGLPGSSVHGDSPGKNTRMDCHALLQGIFPTQRSNPHLLCLLHWQVDSLPNRCKWKGIAATGTHGPENNFLHIPTDGGQCNPIPRNSHTPAASIPHASTAEASHLLSFKVNVFFSFLKASPKRLEEVTSCSNTQTPMQGYKNGKSAKHGNTKWTKVTPVNNQK